MQKKKKKVKIISQNEKPEKYNKLKEMLKGLRNYIRKRRGSSKRSLDKI